MSKTSAWIKAFRLRTLPLAFSSILLGSLIALAHGQFDWVILALCLITTLFLQVLSNLANDYGDSVSGVDGKGRVGPSRTVQDGLISLNQMKRAIVICSALALISGNALIIYAFGDQWHMALLFLILGLGAIAAAMKYTMGQNPYGYAGFGDLFVLIFFGIVGVMGPYYLHTQMLDWSVLLPAISCGLLAVGVLNVNNMRDIVSDEKAGKKSIPVRIGKDQAVTYHGFLIFGAMLLTTVYLLNGGGDRFAYLFVLVIPLLLSHFSSIRRKKGLALDPHLKQLALSTLLYSILLGIGLNL